MMSACICSRRAAADACCPGRCAGDIHSTYFWRFEECQQLFDYRYLPDIQSCTKGLNPCMARAPGGAVPCSIIYSSMMEINARQASGCALMIRLYLEMADV